MEVSESLIYLCLILSTLTELVSGRGKLIEPPMRSSMWRFHPWNNYKKVSKNLDDSALNCGGFWTLHGINDGKCGVCGDPYNAVKRENEAGGRYAQGLIARKYYQDDKYINAVVDIRSNIGGYFEFYLCPNNNTKRKITQECLNKYPLNIHRHGKRYEPDTDRKHYLQLDIPDSVTCTQCVLQWKWVGSHYWGICQDGYGGVGCGDQEEYYNCADIAILPARNISETDAGKSNSMLFRERYISQWMTDANVTPEVNTESPINNGRGNTTFFTTTPVLINVNTPSARSRHTSMNEKKTNKSSMVKSQILFKKPNVSNKDSEISSVLDSNTLFQRNRDTRKESPGYPPDIFPAKYNIGKSTGLSEVTSSPKGAPTTIKPEIDVPSFKTTVSSTVETTSSSSVSGVTDISAGWNLGGWVNRNPALPLAGLDFEEALYLLPLLSTTFLKRDRISGTMQPELLPFLDFAKVGGAVSGNSIMESSTQNTNVPSEFAPPYLSIANTKQPMNSYDPRENLFKKAVEIALKRNQARNMTTSHVTGLPVTIPRDSTPVVPSRSTGKFPPYLVDTSYPVYTKLIRKRIFYQGMNTSPKPPESTSPKMSSTDLQTFVARMLSSQGKSRDDRFTTTPPPNNVVRPLINDTVVQAVNYLSNYIRGPYNKQVFT